MTANETLKKLVVGQYSKLEKIAPAGSLEARLEKDGAIKFHWRGAIGKKSVRVPIGTYDRNASPKSVKPTMRGYSITAAIRAAESIAIQHIENRDAGGYDAIRDAKRQQAAQAYQAKIEADEQTLEKLLLAYVDYLESQGRDSYRDARSIFNLHVIAAFPKLANKAATQVTPEEVADMMRRLLEKGKGRTANKLRSYVRAAYQTAKSARLNARIPIRFKDFKVTFNPAADTVPDSTQNKSGKNPLDQDQLITYWQSIRDVPGLRGAALRLHLLTGGQRIAQLVALLTSDIAKDTITIYDGKGRPGSEPRPHLLPLIPAAKKALDEAVSGGTFALSTDGGETHVHATTLLKWAQETVQDVIPDFKAKQVRSGVETLLSKYGVSKDIRGRLQSHGIAGVQDRHYDGHDYLPEKKKALMTLYNALEQKKAKVTPIRSTAA